jgi:hypothetical protein
MDDKTAVIETKLLLKKMRSNIRNKVNLLKTQGLAPENPMNLQSNTFNNTMVDNLGLPSINPNINLLSNTKSEMSSFSN